MSPRAQKRLQAQATFEGQLTGAMGVDFGPDAIQASVGVAQVDNNRLILRATIDPSKTDRELRRLAEAIDPWLLLETAYTNRPVSLRWNKFFTEPFGRRGEVIGDVYGPGRWRPRSIAEPRADFGQMSKWTALAGVVRSDPVALTALSTFRAALDLSYMDSRAAVGVAFLAVETLVDDVLNLGAIRPTANQWARSASFLGTTQQAMRDLYYSAQYSRHRRPRVAAAYFRAQGRAPLSPSRVLARTGSLVRKRAGLPRRRPK